MTCFTMQFERHSFCYKSETACSVLFSIWKRLSFYNHDTTKLGGGLIRLGGRRKSWGFVQFGLSSLNHYPVTYWFGHGDHLFDYSFSFANTYIEIPMSQNHIMLLVWESVGTNLHVLKTGLSLKFVRIRE